MKLSERLLNIAKNNNGIVTAKDAKKEKIPYQILTYLAKCGKLEKSSIGVYILPSYFDDEYFNLQSRCRDGVFSHLSSLILHGLTDINFLTLEMTFKKGYNYSRLLNDGIVCHVSNEFESDVVQVVDPFGNIVNVFSMERTLCDILNPKYKCDIRIIIDAFKMYVDRKDKDIIRLMNLATKFKVEDRVRNYIEVLL